MQKVAVHRVGFLCARFHIDAVFRAVGNHLGAAGESGAKTLIPPGCDHLQPRGQSGSGQFETHLIVALAGSAMGDGVRPLGFGDLNHAFGDQRSGDAGAEKVLSFINRPRLQDGKDKVAGEFLA